MPGGAAENVRPKHTDSSRIPCFRVDKYHTPRTVFGPDFARIYIPLTKQREPVDTSGSIHEKTRKTARRDRVVRFRVRSDQSESRCRHAQAPGARRVRPATRARVCSVSIRVGRVCCGLSVRGLLSCLALSTMTRTHIDMTLSLSTRVHMGSWNVGSSRTGRRS